jgi:hypothetical protein
MPPWKWYSAYDIPNAAHKKDLTPHDILDCIRLLIGTAGVHLYDNFDTSTGTTLADYRDEFIDSANHGYMVMALKAAGPNNSGQQESANTLFFQKSDGLSAHYGEDAWVVSLGLDEADFPAAAEPANSRGYIRGRLNYALHMFMRKMGVSTLYSVDPSPIALPNPAPNARPISRLEYYGRYRSTLPDGAVGHPNRSDWEKVGVGDLGDLFVGQEIIHRYWAGTTGTDIFGVSSFYVKKLRQR